jgi:hypothetical protein
MTIYNLMTNLININRDKYNISIYILLIDLKSI